MLHFLPLFLLCILAPSSAWAATGAELNLTHHWVGYSAIMIFFIAYVLVILEEKIHMRKSKPVMLSAGIIWALIAWIYHQNGFDHTVEEAIRHNFLEYVELFFFLLVAMTYINAMVERGVFDALRDKLIDMRLSYRQLFWVTGILAFIISKLICKRGEIISKKIVLHQKTFFQNFKHSQKYLLL